MPRASINSVSTIFLINSFIVAMTRAKRPVVSLSLLVVLDYLLADSDRTFFSVLLEIPQPSAMGVNISKNG